MAKGNFEQNDHKDEDKRLAISVVCNFFSSNYDVIAETDAKLLQLAPLGSS